jgi:SAM-dependent methyltransferase
MPAPRSDYRSDYHGVHFPTYERIVAGERAGWSSPEDVAAGLAAVRRLLAATGLACEPATGQTSAGVSPAAGGRLLELGCDDGCLTEALARELPYVVNGIEIVPLALDLARQRLNRAGLTAELVQGSVVALPWPDATFAAVVDGLCLHCIVLDDRARALGETYRVLRPGGVFLVMTMCGDPPPEMSAGFDPQSRCLVRGGVAGRHFGTEQSLLAELHAAGFDVAEHWIEPPADPEANATFCAAAVKPA